MSENCYFVDPVDPGPFFLVHRNVFGIPYVKKNLREMQTLRLFSENVNRMAGNADHIFTFAGSKVVFQIQIEGAAVHLV